MILSRGVEKVERCVFIEIKEREREREEVGRCMERMMGVYWSVYSRMIDTRNFDRWTERIV